MVTMFEREMRFLRHVDGTWAEVETQWRAECQRFGDDLDEWAIDAFPVVRQQASEDHPRARALGLFGDDGDCHAVCFVNLTPLPGYEGPVLRVRHLLVAPRYDLEDSPQEDYGRLLTSVFTAVVGMTYGELAARHVKFHLRSPADVAFFQAVERTLSTLPHFESVKMRGAWLYLSTKNP